MLSLSETRSLNKVEILLNVIQDLSLTRSLQEITQIVKTAARELVGSDGATFILREGDQCFYADEDAIAPLWKGTRFPMSACISGWVMLNGKSAIIKDIYSDPRIPIDAYRPTFVKSLAMVPIRSRNPIAAVGTYWATPHEVSAEELQLLQALADSTSIAIENVQLYFDLERKVKERTSELEAFSYSVSHDLKSPLRSILGFSDILEEELSKNISAEALKALDKIRSSATQMSHLLQALLDLSRISQAEVALVEVNLSEIAKDIILQLEAEEPNITIKSQIQDGIKVIGDSALLRIALENLIKNAWKFSKNSTKPQIQFGAASDDKSKVLCFVKDNGAGFDMAHSKNLFRAFHRLHSVNEFEGTGIGLATVHKIISRHGGKIWADAQAGMGATFYFEIPTQPQVV